MVSALILVNVSGTQIPDVAKLSLMTVGTVGFLAVGLVCHRYPAVLPAGRTFLVVGSLLVPIDVGATYALFLRDSPLTRPELWLGGSIVAAVLYAALALGGFGAWYARSFVLATVSALVALETALHAGGEWLAPSLVALAIAHRLAPRLAPRSAAALSDPLPPLARVLAPVAILSAVLADSLSTVSGARLAILLLASFAAAFYALDWERDWPRRLSLGFAGLTVLALIFVVRSPDAAYPLTLVALAAACTRASAAYADTAVLRRDLRGLAVGWLVLALPFVELYEDEPRTGAAVFLGATAVLGALEVGRGDHRPGLVIRGMGALDLARPHLYAGVVAVCAAARYVALELPLGRDFHRQILEGRANGLAIAFFPAAVAVAAAAGWAARSRHVWRDALLASSGTGLVVVTLLATDSSLRALIALFATSVIFAGAVLARSSRLLWPAGAFGVVAELATLDAARIPLLYRPEVVLATGMAAFVVGLALTFRRSVFASSARALGLAGVALAVGFEFESATAGSQSVVDSTAWRDGSLVLLVLATRHRRGVADPPFVRHRPVGRGGGTRWRRGADRARTSPGHPGFHGSAGGIARCSGDRLTSFRASRVERPDHRLRGLRRGRGPGAAVRGHVGSRRGRQRRATRRHRARAARVRGRPAATLAPRRIALVPGARRGARPRGGGGPRAELALVRVRRSRPPRRGIHAARAAGGVAANSAAAVLVVGPLGQLERRAVTFERRRVS